MPGACSRSQGAGRTIQVARHQVATREVWSCHVEGCSGHRELPEEWDSVSTR